MPAAVPGVALAAGAVPAPYTPRRSGHSLSKVPRGHATAGWPGSTSGRSSKVWHVNAKRIYRLYWELSLQLRNKVPKRRVKATLRDGRRPPERANETCAMDFVHDQLATGRKIRALTIVDTFMRVAPAIELRFGYRASDVIEVLERVGRKHGFPHAIRVDQGSEFVSRELDLWAYQRGVTLDFSRPGKPTDNAFIESLNGKFRAECLNAHWFMSLDDAQAKCEA